MARSSQLAHSVNLGGPRRIARLRAAFWAVEDALLARTVRRARALAQARPSPAPHAPEPPVRAAAGPTDRVRVLRWVFARGAERLTCELSLSDDDACYELRTAGASVPATAVRLTDAGAAFERQSALEGSLIADGWTLHAYESATIERTR